MGKGLVGKRSGLGVVGSMSVPLVAYLMFQWGYIALASKHAGTIAPRKKVHTSTVRMQLAFKQNQLLT